jgi:general secretion pathway protein H
MVLLLSTIIFGLALPRLRGQLFTNDLGRTTRLIGGLAQDARLCAMREGKQYGIEIDPDRHQLRIFQTQTLADGSKQKIASREIKSVSLPASVQITDVWLPRSGKSRGPVDLLFSARGRADQAIVHLQGASGDQVSLVIEPFLDRVKSVPGYLEPDR